MNNVKIRITRLYKKIFPLLHISAYSRRVFFVRMLIILNSLFIAHIFELIHKFMLWINAILNSRKVCYEISVKVYGAICENNSRTGGGIFDFYDARDVCFCDAFGICGDVLCYANELVGGSDQRYQHPPHESNRMDAI